MEFLHINQFILLYMVAEKRVIAFTFLRKIKEAGETEIARNSTINA